jgi:hypothetical protein
MNTNKELENTFYIYTTGIAEWCTLHYTFKYWQDILINRICGLIPKTFNSINITHSDILLSLTNNDNDDNNEISKKNRTQSDINRLLVDDLSIDPRIKSCVFQKEPLDFLEIGSSAKPYIVLDLAHIFSYLSPTQVYISGHYDEPIGPPMTLNVIYFGYIGQDQVDWDSKMCKRYITNTNCIKINPETGEIVTFITKLFDPIRFKLDNHELFDPSEKITKIMKNLRFEISKIFKNKYGDYEKFDEIFSDNNRSIHEYMVGIIIDKIMDSDLNEKQIEQFVIQNILPLVLVDT